MADIDLDFLLEELSAPSSEAPSEIVIDAPAREETSSSAVNELDSFLDSTRLETDDDPENVDSLLAELEDNRDSLLQVSSSASALDEADLLLNELSVEPESSVDNNVNNDSVEDAVDAEFEGLLSALDAPPPALAKTASSGQYGILPGSPNKNASRANDNNIINNSNEAEEKESPYSELPLSAEAVASVLADHEQQQQQEKQQQQQQQQQQHLVHNDSDDEEIGALLADLERQSSGTAAAQAREPSVESKRVLKRIVRTREEFESAVGDTVFAAQEQREQLDNSIVALSQACRAYVMAVREERRAFDAEPQQRLNESLMIVSKGTKGLAMAAQALPDVPSAEAKMEGILAILIKQVERMSAIFEEEAPKLR